MKLSNRLQAIHDHLPQNCRLADIGTDHGLLMIKAISSGVASFAYGLDINKDPLQQAHDNVVRFAMEDKIELILSDGLKSFTKTADTFVLAGMGTELIWSIMEDYPFKAEDTIIIQSNTKHFELRHLLNDNGFIITKEIYMTDQGKPVFIQVVKLGKTAPMSACDAHLGAYLIEHRDDVYTEYLEQRKDYLKAIAHNNTKLNEEYTCILNVLEKGASHE